MTRAKRQSPSDDRPSYSWRRLTVIDYDANEVHMVFEDATIVGSLESVNKIIEALGYKPVVYVQNLMSKKWLVEDYDTPNYLSVGSEAYWSA